jgi:hypothetical protein
VQSEQDDKMMTEEMGKIHVVVMSLDYAGGIDVEESC